MLVFYFAQTSRESSKITTVVAELNKLYTKYRETKVMEKAVIVSQWTSMLEIIKSHIESIGIRTSITWIVSHVTTTYATATLNTLRRLSSAISDIVIIARQSCVLTFRVYRDSV